jgi:hypothetical protein
VREAKRDLCRTGIRRPKSKIDPYAGVDIKGKWLLVSGSPGPAGRGAPRPNPALGKIGIDYTTINEVARFGGRARHHLRRHRFGSARRGRVAKSRDRI